MDHTNNNVSYEISEKENDKEEEENGRKESSSQFANNVIDKVDCAINSNTILNTDFFMDSILANQLNYSDNYILAELKKIATYYDISTRKLRKEELIQEIVLFESDQTHSEIVNRRIKLWSYVKELKQDKYFKPLILF
jgi:hypothetical protein